MAAKTFTTTVRFKYYLESACAKAVESVSKIVMDKLEEFIKEDFYNQYKPLFYTRTYSFLKSPKYNMLNKNSSKVFVDTDVMHYLGISGEDVAQMASYGFHGSLDIFRPGFYWTDFISWCDENVPTLMKNSLREQGLNVK